MRNLKSWNIYKILSNWKIIENYDLRERFYVSTNCVGSKRKFNVVEVVAELLCFLRFLLKKIQDFIQNFYGNKRTMEIVYFPARSHYKTVHQTFTLDYHWHMPLFIFNSISSFPLYKCQDKCFSFELFCVLSGFLFVFNFSISFCGKLKSFRLSLLIH